MIGTGTYGVGIIGYGRVGQRRAQFAHEHPKTEIKVIAEINSTQINDAEKKYDCKVIKNWKDLIMRPDIQIVTVSVPNGLGAEMATAALRAGKHVLMEKPMGKNILEAKELAEVAKKARGRFKVGFNHRYHPAIRKALRLCKEGRIGKIINIRARYGHGGRPGYEGEWRGNKELAGGGELTDQGVHVLDLIYAFTGMPSQAFAWAQTAVWPIQPLEDNGFGLLRFSDGTVASFHTSWTQWKNLFSFEVFGDKGSLVIDGLGQSYGPQSLQTAIRRPEMRVLDVETESFEDTEHSWRNEWEEFMGAVDKGIAFTGSAENGLCVMKMLDALYRSIAEKGAVEI